MIFYVTVAIIIILLLYLFPKTTITIVILLIVIWNSGDDGKRNIKSGKKWIRTYVKKDGTIVEGHRRK